MQERFWSAKDYSSPIHLTESQLAERWQVSLQKLRADRVAGRGVRYLKISRLVRYSLADIEAFEDKHAVGGMTSAGR